MSLRYALINPPLTDPTSPYHSISYLVGAAEAAGFPNGSVLDANILALEFASSEGEVAELLREAEEIRCSLERARHATRLDQLQYRSALAGVGLTPERVASAVATLKDPSRFYDGQAYAGSMLALTRWLDLLNLRGLPVQFNEFGGNLRGSISFTRSSDLTNALLLDQIARPFAGYFDSGFRKFITGGDFDLIGLSVNYIFQLPYAIWMSRAIARAAPRAVLCIGGTEIADIVKYLVGSPPVSIIRGVSRGLYSAMGRQPSSSCCEPSNAANRSDPAAASSSATTCRSSTRLLRHTKILGSFRRRGMTSGIGTGIGRPSRSFSIHQRAAATGTGAHSVTTGSTPIRPRPRRASGRSNWRWPT